MSLLGVTGTPHTALLEVYDRDTGDGQLYAAPTQVRCRVEATARQVQQPDGRVVTLVARVWWPGTVAVKPGDRVTFTAPGVPGSGERRRVETVDAPVWLDGKVMHYEIGLS